MALVLPLPLPPPSAGAAFPATDFAAAAACLGVLLYPSDLPAAISSLLPCCERAFRRRSGLGAPGPSGRGRGSRRGCRPSTAPFCYSSCRSICSTCLICWICWTCCCSCWRPMNLGTCCWGWPQRYQRCGHLCPGLAPSLWQTCLSSCLSFISSPSCPFRHPGQLRQGRHPAEQARRSWDVCRRNCSLCCTNLLKTSRN